MLCIKTEAGQLAFKALSPLLTARQRAAFILFDGVKTRQQVQALAGGLGVTSADIDQLLENGFLQPVADLLPPG